MTTFRIIDHDCETDPAAVNVKECKVDAPSSVHALAEYLGLTLAEMEISVLDSSEDLWYITRSWDGSLKREVGAVAL